MKIIFDWKSICILYIICCDLCYYYFISGLCITVITLKNVQHYVSTENKNNFSHII